MKSIWDDDRVTILLEGRIDSNNAAAVEKEINSELSKGKASSVVLDAENLDYISSAGLRTVLRLRKQFSDISVINVSSEIYDIFEMTGFTEMLDVKRAYRVVSVEGCEEIGRGANGKLYRIDQDNVVKVYRHADALAEIEHEREVAKLALILGIPTAISYDVVRVGKSFGSVFELLNAKSFAKILSTEPQKLEWCVQEYAEMLKLIHSTLVPAGKLPDMRQTAISWAKFLRDYLPEEAGKKLVSLVEAVPQDDHMIHGDYHTKNLELQDDEVLLIDMDTLAVGHPIFELGSMFNAFIGFYEMNSEAIKSFQGFDFETSKTFWHRSLAAYLGTNNEEVIRDVENKARIIGYTRLIRRSIRRGGLESEEGKAEIEHWTKELLNLLKTTDTLLFDNITEEKAPANEIDVEAIEENLNEVMLFIDGKLEAVGCPMKVQMQIDVAVEEIFVNVSKYAYYPSVGRVKVGVDISDDLSSVVITFTDKGKPYDPLAKKDPDVTLSAEERPIGGLGIFMVKKSMDSVDYEYKDGCNILRLTKKM